MPKIRNFLSNNKRGASFGTLLFISVLLILNSQSRLGSMVKGVGGSFFGFFQNGFSGTLYWVKNTAGSIDQLRELKIQHEELKAKLSYYEGIERNLIELTQENQRLSELLDFSAQIALTNVPARIIGKDPETWFTGFNINRGMAHGIQVNDIVIAFNDGFYGLVGKIAHVNLTTAQVKPLTHPSNYIAARLQDSRYEGLVEGLGRESEFIAMNYVKKRAKDNINYGDLVITSGMQSIYPKGIYMGRVRAVEDKDYESSLRLFIEPIIDFGKLEYVLVIQQEKEE